MKLTLSALVPALCWTASVASAASASIYTYDPPSHQSSSRVQSRSLSPVAARLVLAQRAGVEEYHSADFDSDEVIDAINDFGVRTSLFGQEKVAKTVFILLDNVKEMSASIPALDEYASFTVDPAPASAASRELYLDLARQLAPGKDLRIDSDMEAGQKSESDIIRNGDHEYHFHRASSMAELQRLFHDAIKSKTASVTAMVMPLNGSTHAASWGTYEIPGAQSLLKKREQKEEPLEMPPIEKASPSSAPLTSAAKNKTEPLKGILPACFTSQSACESTTRNCTGHGRCHLKYTNKNVKTTSPLYKCYACECSATTSQNSEGHVSTTTWGGPACQKRDVSIQFWMIALFSVGMIFLVSFAVGSVWTMGDEELPSVIGAGVSGPVKRS